MPDIYGYTGPAATVLKSGAHVAPGTTLAKGDLTEEEVKFFTDQGWLSDLAAEQDFAERQGEATVADLRQRASELDIQGRTKMSAEELRAAVAEAEAAKAAENGES